MPSRFTDYSTMYEHLVVESGVAVKLVIPTGAAKEPSRGVRDAVNRLARLGM
jgi:hypothetical protein